MLWSQRNYIFGRREHQDIFPSPLLFVVWQVSALNYGNTL